MPSVANNRLFTVTVVAAAVFVIIWGIRNIAGILNPILLAAVITISLLPVPTALMKRGMRSGTALLITIALVVLVLVGIGALVLLSVSQLGASLPMLTEQYQTQQLEALPEGTTAESLAQDLARIVDARQFSALFGNIVAATGNAVVQFFLTLLIFVFMLYTAMAMPNLSKLGIDMESDMLNRFIDVTAGVRRYVGVSTLINLIVGLGNAVLLWVLGVPFALLWGIVAWVLGYIPAVGYWLALIPPLLIAYGLYGFRTAAIVFVGYALINGTASNIISPRILGQSLRISPLVVFVSVFIWGTLLGAVGAILAMPLMMLLIAVLDSFEQTRWLATLMRFVPGSDKEEDVAAVDQVKGIWERVRSRLPGLGANGAASQS